MITILVVVTTNEEIVI